MKAMILAAGFGSRLLPYTRETPKPLFTVGQKSVLEDLIEKLIHAGCEALVINTHHLAKKLEDFLSGKRFSIPVFISREKIILGSGGAIKKVKNFWGRDPFLVVNSDIWTDIDFSSIYRFHLNHEFPATLALTDFSPLNSVAVDESQCIRNFHPPPEKMEKTTQTYTFTGIQVLDRKILNFIPPNTFYSSIDAYKNLIRNGGKIKAFFDNTCYWKDIGTPERYRETVLENMAPQAFRKAFAIPGDPPLKNCRLKGDGSDRNWSRIYQADKSLVCAEHGIHAGENTGEAEAFVKIGRHLFSKGVPVPEIYHYDIFSGFIFLRDLGDCNLMEVYLKEKSEHSAEKLYRNVIKKMCLMWSEGANGFKHSWTFQTSAYDRALILEKECRYFTEAFLQDFSGFDITFEDLAIDFFHLADQALQNAYVGFMHRDFQSRNIMIHGGEIFFIDFQGGRIGPIQYDLASLLIDPYTSLPESMQKKLVDFCIDHLGTFTSVCPDRFKTGYRYCAIARNLQILGAFSFLSRVKKKMDFIKYIPRALDTLKSNLEAFFPPEEFPFLKAIVKRSFPEQV